jgi:hypothetical protein
MKESEEFLFATTCKGTLQNLKEPVTISIAHNIQFTLPSVACPFAKETEDHNIKCTAPIPETIIPKREIKALPLCYQLVRKVQRNN